MPAKFARKHTLPFMKYQVQFTLSALRADPNATDLEKETQGWLPAIEAVAANEDAYYQQGADNTAARGVADYYLDATCRRFALELYMEEDGNRDSTRYRRYFSQSPGDFVKQALSSQVAAVKGWLTTANDTLLEKYRPDLERWTAAASSALENEAALVGIGAGYWTARESLAKNLTAWRDQLHAELVKRGIERDLRRDWPDLFFKVMYSSRDSSADDTPPETETVE